MTDLKNYNAELPEQENLDEEENDEEQYETQEVYLFRLKNYVML